MPPDEGTEIHLNEMIGALKWQSRRSPSASNCASRAAGQKIADLGLAWLMLATQMEAKEAPLTRRTAAPGSAHPFGVPRLVSLASP
jgi:hypothetical protein